MVRMNRKYLAAGAVCAALCGLCLWLALDSGTSATENMPNVTPHTEYIPPAETGEPEEPSYESPIDFAALRQKNPDIYAWIQIPGTEIDYPILQREGGDAFYIDHDSDGDYSPAGALFTESTYNGTDFEDPVTIIYGHYMRSGTMFGTLQANYSEAESFEAHRQITVYLPERELNFTVFAAVPYDSRHILYNYNFESTRMYRAFLDSIYEVRAIGANFAEDTDVTEEDRLLILSTCLAGDNTRRYLVLAKLEDSVS